MKKIIVGFSCSTKTFAPFSQGIKLWGGTDYSHVYFQFKSTKYNVDMIYQASSTMLNYMSKEVFLLHNEIVKEFEIEITEEQYSNLMEKCMRSAGLPYAKLQIVGILIADVFELENNPFPNKDMYVCSEWVAERLEDLGYKFKKPLDLIKPIDVFEVLTHDS